MKKVAFIAIYLISFLTNISAQIPNNFKYQAVVRNSAGEVLINKPISLKISVLPNSAQGIAVYAEVFNNLTTNDFGLISVEVGRGSTVISGSFSSIDWGSGPYFMQVDIDINGGETFQFMGTSQIQAVPYALYALNVKNKDDADADPINEIQDLQLVNNVLTITKNNTATPINLAQYVGTDTDEQTLSTTVSSNKVDISILRGNTITFNLPSDFVKQSTGGDFLGPIHSTNIKGSGILDLAQNLSLSGTGSVLFNSLGSTNLTLPVSGTLATQDYVTQSINTSNLLPTGNILVGNASNIATNLVASNLGHILLGNGTTLNSVPVTGDASLNGTGVLTLSSIGPTRSYGNGIINVDDKGRVTSGTNPNSLSGYGIIDGLHTTLSSGNLYIGNSSNIASQVSISGDATLSNSGVLTLNSTSVNPGIYTRVNVDSKGRITFGDNPTTLLEHNILDGLNKTLINRNIFIGNSSNIASQTVISGDATLENTGVLTISRIGNQTVNLGGSFNTGGSVTFSGANSLVFTLAGPTNITLPTSGILATTSNSISNTLATGSILVGVGNIATPMLINGNGQILIGNGTSISPQNISGDASLTNNGVLSISKIGGNNVNLGGAINTGGALTLSGANSVSLSSTGTTNLILPTSGTLATTSNTISNILATGSVLVGTAGVATALNANANGQILIGNGSTITSQAISGDATLSSNGILTISSIGNNPVNLGGAFNTGGSLTFTGSNSVSFTSTGATNLTLPTAGTIATTSNTISNSLTNGNILIGNASNQASQIAVSGDASLASNGLLTISNIGGDQVNLGGSLNTGGSLTFTGSNSVSFTSTGLTSLTLPTSGTLATTGSTISNTLATGNILIGVGNIATPLAANGNGQILIGNGSTLASQTISGDAVLANNGTVTISSIGGDVVNLGGSLNTGGSVTFTGSNSVSFTTLGATNLTLPTSGTLATTSNTVSNSLTNGDILIGNAFGIATQIPVTGDATLSNTGVLNISSIGGDAVNLGGTLITGGALNFTGANSVTFTSSGPTNLILPVSGTIATTNNTISNTLTTGSLLVGIGNIATPLAANGNGQILIGNGTTLTSQAISGDAILSNNGALTVSSIGGNTVTLGGSLNTGGSVAFSGSNTVVLTTTGNTNLTLPTSGTLATTSNTVSNNLATGSILVGVGNIATALLANGNGQILIGNGSNISPHVLSGDATLSNSGVISVSSIGGNSVSLGGSLITGGSLSFSGSSPVTITSTGITNVTIPTSGTLATTANTISNSLANGNILIGNGSGIAVQNAISGDASISNTGILTISSIGNKSVVLGGSFATTVGSITLAANASGSNVTLPQSGILATESYVTSHTGTNITAVGTISSGVWNGSQINGSYIDWTAPGKIGSLTPNSGSFTSLNISMIVNLLPSAQPSSPNVGDIYLDSGDSHIYFWNGSAWKQLDN